MPDYIPIIVFVALLFGAMILRLATSRGFSNKLTGWLVVIAAFGGFIFYGYAYAQHESDPFLAVIRALLSVCDMFTGSVDENAIEYAKLYVNPPSLILFWLIHLMALYSTASATIAIIGAEALRKLRVWLSRWGNLNIIYGATAESIEFARKLPKNSSIVYVDPTPGEGSSNGIKKNDYLLRSDNNALSANKAFAKSVGIRRGKRSITLYANGKDGAQNLSYAKALLDTLQECRINPEQTRLVIWGVNEYVAAEFKSVEGKYGYGTVNSILESELAARVLIRKYPPCQTIQFDENGLAQQDFHALVIGFGQLGQNVFQQLLSNGQFYGSRFRCDIFDPNFSTISDFLPEQMLANYDIRPHCDTCCSKTIHSFLKENIGSLNYIAVCTGSDDNNKEIASDIALYCLHKKVHIPIYQISRERIIQTQVNLDSEMRRTQIQYLSAWYDLDDLDPGTLNNEKIELFDPNLIHVETYDMLAMSIHHSYIGTNQSALQLWMECPHFIRTSCRSAADYMEALFHAVGIAKDGKLCTTEPPEKELLINLAISEHMRWCAFHFCHGYCAMTHEQILQRAEMHRANHRIRVMKDVENRTHACLIPWDQLDELSSLEHALTGRSVDYKQYDIDNVLTVYRVMSSCKEMSSHIK